MLPAVGVLRQDWRQRAVQSSTDHAQEFEFRIASVAVVSDHPRKPGHGCATTVAGQGAGDGQCLVESGLPVVDGPIVGQGDGPGTQGLRERLAAGVVGLHGVTPALDRKSVV